MGYKGVQSCWSTIQLCLAMKPSGILIRLLVGLLAFCAIMPMASFKERPGMCPTPPPDKVTPCIASCAEDSACLWPEKCCSWGCRKSCLTPVYAFCHLPPNPGPCRGNMPRYFYNPVSKSCEEFIYGGCHGNKNNFKTLEKCRLTCAEKPGICPKAPPGTITICPVMCGSDWDCPGNEKCCPYGCMIDCMKPL